MADPTRRARRLGDLTPYVRVVSGVLRGHVVPVHDRLEIGRASSSDIQLLSTGVSRTHAVIIPREGKYVLIDMLSTNGTFVAGERIAQHVLEFGDHFTIGDQELVFELFDEATPEVPSESGERARRPTHPIVLPDERERDAPNPRSRDVTYPGELLADIVVYRNLRLRAVRGGSLPKPLASRLEQLDATLRSGAPTPEGPAPFRRYSVEVPARIQFEGDQPRAREVVLVEIAVDGATCTGDFHDVELDALCWVSVHVGADGARRVVFTCRVFWARADELGLVFSGAPGSPEHEREKKATTQKLRAVKS